MQLSMNRIAAILGLGAPMALYLGWASASVPEDGAAIVAQRVYAIPVVEHPGLQIGLAAAQFGKLGLSVPVLAVEAPPEAVGEAAPPQEPIEVLFAQSLTAIQSIGARGAVWIVDLHAEEQRRLVRRGQEFRDGWVIAQISDQEIVLKREDESRSVNPFGG